MCYVNFDLIVLSLPLWSPIADISLNNKRERRVTRAVIGETILLLQWGVGVGRS